MTLLPSGGPAIPVSVDTTRTVQGGAAIPVYGYTTAPTDGRPALAGPALPVRVLTAADLKQNGGQWTVEGRPYALPVYTAPATVKVAGGAALAVYPVNAWPTVTPTVTLPQNLLVSAGTLYEGFENKNDWTVANGSAADNTSEFKTGAQSVKLTNSGNSSVTMTKTVNWDLSSTWQHFTIWFYLHNTDLTDYDSNSVIVSLSNDSGFTNFMRTWLSAASMSIPGWYALHCAKADFGAVSAGTFANPIIRIRLAFQSATGKTCSVSFDSVYFGVTGTPAVLLYFDDGYASQYSTCFAYMNPRKIRGSIAAQTNLSNISTAQYQEMDAAGWCIANHTNGSTALQTLNEAQQEAAITGGHDALNAIGLHRGAHYVIYPGGTFNTDTMTAMANLGMLTGRNGKLTSALGNSMLALPYAPMLQMPSNGVTSGTSVATFTGLVDKAIAGGYVMPFHWHDVGGAGQMTAADFRTCMDYIYTKQSAGLLYSITADDLYQLTLGPVTIPA